MDFIIIWKYLIIGVLSFNNPITKHSFIPFSSFIIPIYPLSYFIDIPILENLISLSSAHHSHLHAV